MTSIAFNLKKAVERAKNSEEKFTIEKLSKKAGMSKTTIYDIMEDRVKPRKSTLKMLEDALGIAEGSLSRKHEYFDKDYFFEQVGKIYDNNPVVDEQSDRYTMDPNYDGGEIYYSLEEYLMIECGMEPDSFIYGKMPEAIIQDRVSKIFNIPTEDLFRPINELSLVSANLNGKPRIEKVNVLSLASVNETNAIKLFKKLDPSYQKAIYNMMCDFYLLSHKYD